ncbi:phage tail tape measure protein [Clostridium kluyveri]|uniref:Phage tail tape measure protein n=1 Tax=Clostridium kluyveri TaxID=1534 RepID=A0A1L5FBT9_CLOKL|nr:phage tail tape measure protein [Clostridium kluyveri]APM40474.1 phage tail tape measure protein [Clostridium kluyveri]
MANKEIYRIDIAIGVSGDSETQGKLSAMEKMAEQTKNKLKALDKIKASPSAKLKDDASTTIDKIKSRTDKLNGTTAQAKVKAEDGASKVIDKIENKAEKLNNKNVKPKIDADNKASKIIEETETKAEKLDNKKATVKIKAQDEATKTINNVESKINGWIKTGAKKIISVGIAGVLATGGIGLGTSIKTFSQYEQGLSNVKAVTEATDKQMKQLGDTAKSLGASTAWSAVQVTEAEELLGQAGFSVQETITALPGLLSLASAGSLDLASATDIASGTLRAFSLNASDSAHVADVLALSASATNSDVTDLGETMKYVAPVSASLGISLEDTAAAAGLLSNQNIKGSQAGTVLRQAMARLASPTEEAADVMKEYGINAFDAQGNMKPLSGVVDNLNSSLGKLTSQQRADAISTIFGTESMSGILALMNQGGESLSSLSQKLKDAKGSADKMAETKLDNLAGQWEQLKGAVETAQIELGERLAPYAKEFVTWLTGKMPEITDSVVKFVDYISKNTTTIKTLAATVVGLSAAFAGFSAVGKIGNTITGIKGLASVLKGGKVAEETVKVAGGLRSIGVVGRLLPLILNPVGLAIAGTAVVAGTAITANANLMKKSLSTTTEELSTTEKIMNKLNGSIYKSKKEMSKLGLVYDDFGSGISDSFKTAAQDASKSLLEIEMNIQRLVRDGSIDDADNMQLKGWVDKFTNEAIEAIREKQSQIKDEFQKTFSLDGVTSDAEQNVMDYLSSYFEEGVNKELAIRDEIYSIGDKAIKDHGKILDSDIKEIRDKLAELKSIQLEYANAESAGERAYASSKFTSKAEKVTGIEGASQLLQDRAKEYKSQIDEINANYDKTIATTKYLLSSPKISSESKAKLESGLKETTAARDKALKEAEEAWKSDLETLYKTYPKAKGKINKYDGTELTGGDIKTQGSLEKIKSKYSDLKNITKSGFYGIRNSATGEMNAMYVSVEKSTGDIVGAWNVTTQEIGAYTTDIKSKVKELGNVHQSTIGGAIKYLSDMGASYDAVNNRIVSSSGQAIGELGKVSIAANGTRTMILNLNGTPVQITSNAEGQITSITEVGNAVKNVPPGANVTITDNANESKQRIAGAGNEADRVNGKTSTITITTIFKKVIQTVEEFFTGKDPDQKANGTNYFSGGLSTVDERGWELSQNKSVPVLGNYNGDPLTYMSRGTKILNHMQSVQDMKKEVSRQINEKMANKPSKVQYQLIKPQQKVQVAAVGGLSFGDINVNVGSDPDIDEIVIQATKKFATELKKQLQNIKR